MKIKSLLLGSTAAMVAISGAHAADAVVAEPEPVEYVRVCDAYGAGYFYIPGTQTCMRISGNVRSELRGGENGGARVRGDIKRDTYAYRARATMNFQTASETDLGTLRTLVQLRYQWQGGGEYSRRFDFTKSGAAGASSPDLTQLRFAYIELGGVRVGLDESIFNHWTGYHGAVLNDDIVSPMLYTRTSVISYTFNAGNGFSAILGLEQGNEELSNQGYTFGYRGGHRSKTLSSKIDDYTPNVVGGLKFVQGWGGVSGVVAYDSYYEKWSGKARLNVNVNDQLSLWVMGGYKSADDYYNIDLSFGQNGSTVLNGGGRRYGVYRLINSIYGDWGGHWAVWGGSTYKLNDKTRFNSQLSYDQTKTFAASVDVQYQLIPGLTVTPEVNYVHWDDGYSATSGADQYVSSMKGQHAVQGMVRLQRTF